MMFDSTAAAIANSKELEHHILLWQWSASGSLPQDLL
jgi:hypothetical protein